MIYMINFNNFEAMTFDCYGTLIDWEEGILKNLKPIFQNYNVKIPDSEILEVYAQIEINERKKDYKKYKEILRNVVFESGKKYGFSPTDDEAIHFANSIKNWSPFPDTVPALNILKKEYKLGIISNIDNDLFAYTKQKLKVNFDWIITAEAAKSYKPSINNFKFALNKMALPKEKILHVAQSLYHDIVPAKKLGIATIWVNRRKGKEGFGATPPSTSGCDLEVNNLEELIHMIGLS